MKTTAIIPAAGSGKRMGKPKMFLMLGSLPVLAHTLRSFDNAETIDEVIISAREQDILLIWDMISEFGIKKVSKIINGGSTRTESVAKALTEASDDTEIIAVHDGARPLITSQLIDFAVGEAKKLNAVTLGVPVKDTIKRTAANNVITETLERESLYHIQTPQVFRSDILRDAYERAENIGIDATDDCGLVEQLGVPVHIIEGDYQNIKITTLEDLTIGESLLWKK